MKLFKQSPSKKLKGIVKKISKPFRKRDFMLKFLTVTMTVALVASMVLPYLIR